jgi:hypothetical protein
MSGLLLIATELRDIRIGSFVPIPKIESCTAPIFGETLEREAIGDSDNLSRATEVAYEFNVMRSLRSLHKNGAYGSQNL